MLKVTLEDGTYVGTTLPSSLALSSGPSFNQKVVLRVETELRGPDGGIRVGRNGENVIGEDGWARPGCSPINLASGQLTSSVSCCLIILGNGNA